MRKHLKKHESEFKNALYRNKRTYNSYYERLIEIALTCFKYENVPDTVDIRTLEMSLISNGAAVFFKDEDIGFLALPVLLNGNFDVYGVPYKRTAYSNYNSYRYELDRNNSVIMYNNYMRSSDLGVLDEYSTRLYEYDRIIDVNVRSQKTPVLLQGSDKQQLTLKQLYMQYDGNIPFIFGDKNLNPDALKVLKTDAPYVSDKIYDLKQKYWNECLTYLGVANLQENKKERVIVDEVSRQQGGTIASRQSRLLMREYAVKQINEMFNLNITVDFNENADYNLNKGGVERGEVYNDNQDNLRESE